MSNAAIPQSVSRFDRIDDDTTSEEQPFWLYDPDGEPVVLPPSCVGFQVRYWLPNQRGLGTIVVDARNGRPLILPRTVTPDEFAERVGYKVGRYRLFLLDASHRRLNVDPAQIEITPEMAAARRGELASTEVASSPASSSSSSEPSSELLGHVFSFVEKANAQAMAQIAGVHRELSERLGQVVDAMAGLVRAAGDSGVVQKSTALAAASAGAPVIVQQVAPVNGNAPASPAAAPSSAAPRNAASGATAAAAAAEKGGVADALMALGMPLIEKLAPVAAYGMAQKMDVPEEVARDLAGFVKTATQTAGAMLKGDESSEVAATSSEAGAVEVPTRTGAELLAHVVNIQSALPDDDRAWVLGQMAKRRNLVDAFKPAVASISVEDGVRAVASLRAMDAALTTAAERACFDRLLQPDLLPQVFHNLFVTTSPEAAIGALRAQAEQVERAQSAGA